MPQAGKIAYALINGQFWKCKHDLQYTPGGHSAEPVAADGVAYAGVQREPTTASFSFTVVDTSDTDINELRDLQDMTLVLIRDTGKVDMMALANWSEPPEYQNGEISCQGFGKPTKKIA